VGDWARGPPAQSERYMVGIHFTHLANESTCRAGMRTSWCKTVYEPLAVFRYVLGCKELYVGHLRCVADVLR